jgi:tRNA threonylcarbamoyl adenosine modification protein YjeE
MHYTMAMRSLFRAPVTYRGLPACTFSSVETRILGYFCVDRGTWIHSKRINASPCDMQSLSAMKRLERAWSCRWHSGKRGGRVAGLEQEESHVEEQHCSIKFVSTSCHSTAIVAAYLVHQGLQAGDCFLLYGNVGAGKSFFSREFIRFALDDPDLEVPSPTYLLHNMYNSNQDHADIPILHHYDLYRLIGEGKAPQGDIARLDLHHSLKAGVCLIEWPDLLNVLGILPARRVEIRISLMSSESRQPVSDDDDDDELDGCSSERLIEVHCYGERWCNAIFALDEHIIERGESLGLHKCLQEQE